MIHNYYEALLVTCRDQTAVYYQLQKYDTVVEKRKELRKPLHMHVQNKQKFTVACMQHLSDCHKPCTSERGSCWDQNARRHFIQHNQQISRKITFTELSYIEAIVNVLRTVRYIVNILCAMHLYPTACRLLDVAVPLHCM